MNLFLIILILLSTADMSLTIWTLKLYRKARPKDSKWYKRELNPIVCYLLKKVGIRKAFLLFFPCAIALIIWMASSFKIENFYFFYGVYFIVNMIHLHNIEFFSSEIKKKENRGRYNDKCIKCRH